MAAFRDRDDAAANWPRPWPVTAASVAALAVPRGGVPMGRALADALEGDSRRRARAQVGSPHQPELAIGAVDEHGHVVLDGRGRGALRGDAGCGSTGAGRRARPKALRASAGRRSGSTARRCGQRWSSSSTTASPPAPTVMAADPLRCAGPRRAGSSSPPPPWRPPDTCSGSRHEADRRGQRAGAAGLPGGGSNTTTTSRRSATRRSPPR